MTKDKLDQLREYYDNTDMSEAIKTAKRDDSVVDEPMIGITVRFPKTALDRLRSLADARGVRVTALIRDLAEQGAAADTDEPLTIAVADLQRLIAERSQPAA